MFRNASRLGLGTPGQIIESESLGSVGSFRSGSPTHDPDRLEQPRTLIQPARAPRLLLPGLEDDASGLLHARVPPVALAAGRRPPRQRVPVLVDVAAGLDVVALD